MTYRIKILPSALKELGQLPLKEHQLLDKRIQAVAVDPRPFDVIAMKGICKGLLQLKVGNYKVVFLIEEQHLVVFVGSVLSDTDMIRQLG